MEQIHEILADSHFPDEGYAFYSPDLGGRLLIWNETVPSDDTAGYPVGGLLIHTDGGDAGDLLYANIGTKTLCEFVSILPRKVGSSSSPKSVAVEHKFVEWYFKNTYAGGDNRGIYLRQYLAGAGASGDALRAFSTVDGVTAANQFGAHISASYANSGKTTGLAVGCRATFHVPNDAAWTGGTICGGMSELWHDGANSTLAATTHSIHRFVNAGNATGMATATKVFEFVGLSTGASGQVYTGQNEPTWASKTALIRVLVNGTPMNLIAVDPS